MKKMPIALNSISVSDAFNSDMAGTFKKIRDIGYDGVEVFRNPVYDVLEMKAALEGAGLSLFGWHTDWERLQPDLIDSTIAYHKYIGNPYVVICALGGIYEIGHTQQEECEEVWAGYARQINSINEKLRRHGLTLGYHIHEHELRIKYHGQTLLDFFYDKLDPTVCVQIDTGNAIQGGGDPAQCIEKYAGRQPSIHLKPYSHETGFDTMINDGKDSSDWEDILRSAGKSGAKWLVVEYYADKEDPFGAAGTCCRKLREIMEGID